MPEVVDMFRVLLKEMTPALVDVYKVGSERVRIEKAATLGKEYIVGAKVANLSEELQVKVSGCPACAPKLRLASSFKEVGRATWRYLHTMASFYPESPSESDRSHYESAVIEAIRGFPCAECSEHALDYLKGHPLDMTSRATLQKSACELHNEVNKKLNKPEFPCG